MKDMSLAGRVALVTGGGRGIGRAVCERLGAAGAHVVVNYAHSAEAAQACVEAIVAAGGSAQALQADVSKGDEVKAMVEQVLAERKRIDILVNNAGIVRDNLLMTMSDDEWAAVLDTNLTGTARCIRAVGQAMMLQKGGSIINLSSVAAVHPNRGQSNYAASKGGVEALTRAVAVEFARKKIRVNAVAPGVIETEMSQRVRDEAGDMIKDRVPLKRIGQSHEVAAAVHFLASDAAAYITGQVLLVDGGLSLG
jgi:3-oxoacyl-[acyl-carrier protein] reductase